MPTKIKKVVKNSSGFPISTKIRLQVMRQSTNAILPIIQKDKTAPTIISHFDLAYKKNPDNLQKMDWHCPQRFVDKDGSIEPSPTIFYIHGGAWASADKHIYTRLCKDMSERGFVVININYRLLPEYDLETTYTDCIIAIKHCIKNANKYGIDREKIILGGDSAGAHLSALIAGKVSTNRLNLNCNIIGTLLLYGLFNLHHMADSKFSILPPLHKGFKVSKGKSLNRFYHDFSPIYFVSPKFPPSFLTSGKVDFLNPETMEFIEVLKQNNVSTHSLIFPKERKDARHAFINLNNPARQEAIMSIGKSLTEFLTNTDMNK